MRAPACANAEGGRMRRGLGAERRAGERTSRRENENLPNSRLSHDEICENGRDRARKIARESKGRVTGRGQQLER
eukprot:5169888-Pleurochrysis_carterae.AAC.1